MGKCSKIRHIVRLRQMLRRWRLKAAFSSSMKAAPSDVPAGHVAVCVGSSSRRFVVRAAHLNHPVFRQLLRQAEEEYGFPSRAGPISLPCDEDLFEDVLRHISSSSSSSSSSSARFASSLDDVAMSAAATTLPCCCCSHLGRRWHGAGESFPLLRSFSEKAVR